jgi:hypothetical protein
MLERDVARMAMTTRAAMTIRKMKRAECVNG